MEFHQRQSKKSFHSMRILLITKKNRRNFHSTPIKLVTFGSETLSSLTPKIWELVPVEIKNVTSIAFLKRAITKWKPINCPCRLCRTYLFR